MSVAADSGPLISLASISLLDLLASLFHTIHIPNSVYQEVVAAGKGRAGSEEVARAVWIERHEIKKKGDVAKLIREYGLGKGESEAVVLVKEINAGLLIVDDRVARKCAASQKISVIGTAGILLLAKESGFIKSVREPLGELLRGGFISARRVIRRSSRSLEKIDGLRRICHPKIRRRSLRFSYSKEKPHRSTESGYLDVLANIWIWIGTAIS